MTGVVGDQTDTAALQQKLGAYPQHVRPVEHRLSGRQLGRGRAPKRKRPQRLGGERGDLAAQRDDIAFTVGMRAAGHEDYDGARGRVDPDRTAGPTGVTVTADREVVAARARVR